MEEVKMYKCKNCGEVFTTEYGAYECEFIHAKENYANSLWKSGRTLKAINWLCGFNWKLRDELLEVTKENCFIISHWQCCDKPAYQINYINGRGSVNVWGIGGWSGGYGNDMMIDNLPEPHPAEELYKYK